LEIDPMFADRPQVRELSGGRLHLSHGPIDVVLRAWGEPAAVEVAYRAAVGRFGHILPELCRELPRLKAPIKGGQTPRIGRIGIGNAALARGLTPAAGLPPTLSLPHKAQAPRSPVGRRMATACRPFADVFVTPMAAVAGAVADELMTVMRDAAELERAYVNDGGDIAVYCAPGASLDIGIAGDFGRGSVPWLNGRVRIDHGDGVGGIATSGARGRSFSLGVADSVTVLAADGATADVAATLIANAVDVDHPAIVRRPASSLDPDSDLGDRLVTVSVGELPRSAVLAALEAGRQRAADYMARGLIVDAALMLQGEAVDAFASTTPKPGPVVLHSQIRPRRDSPPRRAGGAPPKCGEGLGVGGTPTAEVWDSPPPCPSPTRGEGTPRHSPRLISTASSTERWPRRTQNAGRAATEGILP
jgi:uncharacterized protein